MNNAIEKRVNALGDLLMVGAIVALAVGTHLAWNKAEHAVKDVVRTEEKYRDLLQEHNALLDSFIEHKKLHQLNNPEQ